MILLLEGGLVPRAHHGQKKCGRSKFCTTLSMGGARLASRLAKGAILSFRLIILFLLNTVRVIRISAAGLTKLDDQLSLRAS